MRSTGTRGAVRLFAFALVMVGTAACSSGGSSTAGGLSGTISGDGSSTVFPITEAVAEEFRVENPGVDATVGVSGTGGGFKKFCNGETDLQNASRPIKDSEKKACAEEGIEYIELTVANDGLAVVANKENDWVDCLTTAELRKIWEPGSKVESWRDVRPSFPAEELVLFGPGTDSGTFDYFTDEINGEEGASRTDYTASEDDNVLVKGVQGTEGGLGYFGYSYYKANAERLKLVGVDGGDGCVLPSDETVKANTYKPLSRPLFIYVKKASLQRPEVKGFVDFMLENVNLLVGDAGFTPLADDVLAKEKAEYDEAVAQP